MAEKYTSSIALLLDAAVEDVGTVVAGARAAGDIDRASAVRGEGHVAQELHWGGRMQKGVLRYLDVGGEHLLRTETYLGDDGPEHGMQRQAQLLQALARQLRGRVVGIRDLSAMTDRDEGWIHRLAVGAVEREDAIITRSDGEGTWWVRTHGAARFDVPDLEIYGLNRAQVPAAEEAVTHVHTQLLGTGLTTDLALQDGTPVYLVPVLEAWQHLPLDWPGVGRAGQDRGPGLDGPRASLSLLKGRRFGRYRKDFEGVVRVLASV